MGLLCYQLDTRCFRAVLLVLWKLMPVVVFYLEIIILLNVRVKSVLYSVLWPSRQTFADFTPFWPQLRKQLDYLEVFFLCPLFPTNVRVQFVDESLPDLFAWLAAKGLGNQSPIVPHLTDHFQNDFVFMGTPYFFVLTQLANPPESV